MHANLVAVKVAFALLRRTLSQSPGRHLPDHAVSEHPDAVDQHVHLTVGVDGLLDHRFTALHEGHVVVVGHSLSAVGLDLRDDAVCGIVRVAGAVDVAAEIVDDDLRSLFSQQKRHATSDAASATGHHRNLSFETVAHVSPPLSY